MSLCSSFNVTVGIFTTEGEEFFVVKDKSVGGEFGAPLHKFLVHSREENHCHFLPVLELGRRLSNGTFTG